MNRIRKINLLFIAVMVLLSSCYGGIIPEEVAGELEQAHLDVVRQNQESAEAEHDFIEGAVEDAAVYEPEGDMAPEELIREYFRQHYLSYTTLTHLDLSSIHDMTQIYNKYMMAWMEELQQRRSILMQMDICYVETEDFPYTVAFIEEEDLLDGRMAYWNSELPLQENEVFLHFTVEGEQGQAYPPLFAVNAQHTMRLKRQDDQWLIVYHYFPGCVRKVWRDQLYIMSREEMESDIEFEFRILDNMEEQGHSFHKYNGELAVEYALQYTERINADFYAIGDWMGNCANFISQCVWYGFGNGIMADLSIRENMTDTWYAGEGGGSPAWESVTHFWTYITVPGGLYGQTLRGISQMRNGDIVQIRNGAVRSGDEYDHSLILVDEDRLVFAQNSPNSFVYYSDIVNMDMRFVRPLYLQR